MAKGTTERLAVSRAGTVLRLALSHPASRNSLSEAMMESLETERRGRRERSSKPAGPWRT